MKKPRILFTEDMIINQVLAKVLFKNLNIHAEYASTGKESWELLMEEEFDVWFVDYYLPDMNALQAVEGIEVHPKPFVVLMSGKPFTDQELAELNKVFSVRLEKPLEQGMLLEALGTAGFPQK